jgi:hypothetical protein
MSGVRALKYHHGSACAAHCGPCILLSKDLPNREFQCRSSRASEHRVHTAHMQYSNTTVHTVFEISVSETTTKIPLETPSNRRLPTVGPPKRTPTTSFMYMRPITILIEYKSSYIGMNRKPRRAILNLILPGLRAQWELAVYRQPGSANKSSNSLGNTIPNTSELNIQQYDLRRLLNTSF